RFLYWRGRLARNQSFQVAAAARLSRIPRDGVPRIVMAYSYMALEIFRLARARGWRTVLGQIDAGPLEERIVASLHEAGRAHCLALERPPAQYWSDWHEECALADRIVVNSSWAQAALEQEGVPPAKIRVVPLAYDGPQTDRVPRKQYPAQFTRS